MNTKNPWKECFVDAERGLAFFDGITIEADSINDPRQDRVFPIFKKEQVFMCRQIRPLLEKWKTRPAGGAHQRSSRPLVLDVGTGSGVLAIWAARHGFKVYAVDISGRSIEFARHNAHANHVKVFEYTNWRDFEQSRQPGIWLHHVRFDEELATTLLHKARGPKEGCFDLIMLNPPYNPTFEGVTPALHANGGLDGQAEFKRQIRLVPGLLRAGGYCAGHQMGVIAAGQPHPNVVSEIEQAFRESNDGAHAEDRGSSAQYCARGGYVKVLDCNRGVTDFLTAQYSTYLASRRYNEAVAKYIERVGSQWAFFSLLYFEFEKRQTEVRPAQVVTMVEIDCKVRPVASKHVSATAWNWETREWLHRCIVEHAASATSIPWSSLFTDYIVSEQMLVTTETETGNGAGTETTNRTNRNRVIDHSPMRLVDQWLAELPPFRGTTPALARDPRTNGSHPPFDFIHLESVPFTPNSVRLPGLRQESAMWLSERYSGDVDRKSKFARSCFAAWAACVRSAYEGTVAPFLHAAFMGTEGSGSRDLEENGKSSREYRNWNPLIHSFVRHDDSSVFPSVRCCGQLDRGPGLSHVYDAFDRHFAEVRTGLRESLSKRLGRESDGPSPGTLEGQSPYSSYYSTKGLAELKVTDVDEYRKLCENRLKTVSGSRDRRDWEWLIDLEYCHATLHGLAIQEFEAAATEYLDSHLKWSYLLSVPLDLSDPLYAVEDGVLPSTFRGSIFLFVGSFDDVWTPRHDRLVLDLARFATLLYSGRFNVEEARSQSFDVLESMGRSFSHEMLAHKLAMRATHQKMSEVFRLEGGDASVPLATEGNWSEPTAVINARAERTQTIASWLVCPTPRIYAGFEDTLSIWGASRNWLKERGLDRDMGFPEAFAKIVEIVSRAAHTEDWSKSLPRPRTFAGALEKDDEFDSFLARLLRALSSVAHEGESSRLSWVKAEDTVGARLTFLRIMNAALSNAVKHLPKDSVAICASTCLPPGSGLVHIEVQNDFRDQGDSREQEKWGTEQVIETLIRDRWGPRAISFGEVDSSQDRPGGIRRWRTSFEIPLTYSVDGRRVEWLRRS